MRILLLTLVIALAMGSANAQVPGVKDGPQLVEADGYQLNLIVTRGDPALPTIVLEAGGGADSKQFARLQPQLARDTGATVISYDRPGYGASPLPVKPYDLVEEVDAIRKAVDDLGLGDKVILVGSSFGGMLIQVWASRAPERVRGLLFLDANSPPAVLAIQKFSNDQPVANPTTPGQLAYARIEKAGVARFAAVYSNPLPIDVPIIVASAEKPLFPDEARRRIFNLSQDLLAASVRNGRRVVAEGSGHNIPGDRPDLVIEWIKELIAPSF